MLLFTASVFLKSLAHAQALHSANKRNDQLKSYYLYFWRVGTQSNFFAKVSCLREKIIGLLKLEKAKVFVAYQLGENLGLAAITATGRA